MKKRYFPLAAALSVILLACLALTSCGGGEQANTSNILRVRLIDDISNLDPAFIGSGIDDTVSRAVMEGLVRYKPGTNELQKVLAESYSVSEDGRVIDVTLRQGVQWQKGYGELTAGDVKFSFERFKDPELASSYADDFAALDRVDVTGKYEFKIILQEPQATLWTTTLPLTSGLIICQKYYEEVGKDKFATTIIGTGPYILDNWQPGTRVTLKKNPDYWGDKAVYDEIQLKAISNDSAAAVALEAGEVDFGLVALNSVDRFERNTNFAVLTVPSNRYCWIGINVENPKLQDINVRQAIRYGIDVPSILKAAYAGKAEQARAILPRHILGHWPDAPLYQRDTAKAREYLAKAGLSSLDLTLTAPNSIEYRTWAEIIQQNLAEAGINVTIAVLDPGSFYEAGKGDKGKDIQLFAMNYGAMSDPAWFTMWFTSDNVGTWNWMRWASHEFDALHKQGLATLDPAQRAQIYIQMQKLWDENVNAVWVTAQPMSYVHTLNVVPVMDSNGIIPMLRDFTPGAVSK
ncbi:MAG: ABC transporter substrate-binding protein [Desulfovibrionaceae bacterium]|nr:ABC transporter substrate-binding protein [Desulfovibrionaceae bacterium]